MFAPFQRQYVFVFMLFMSCYVISPNPCSVRRHFVSRVRKEDWSESAAVLIYGAKIWRVKCSERGLCCLC